jgi:hypothetical protein
MSDFFNNNLFNILLIVAILISVFALILSTNFILKRKVEIKNSDLGSKKDINTDSRIIEDKLKKEEKVIADLNTKLELKKTFDDELIKTIYEVDAKENFDSKDLVKELKLKLLNLSEIDKKHIVKNSTALDYKGLFQKALEQFHPELSYKERILCTYFRLHLSTKEISVIEGITIGTVRIYKNKIKQKMGLNAEESLNEYLCNFSTNKTA